MGFDFGANNLGSLCFQMPKFVFPSFPWYSENNSGGCRNGCSPAPPKDVEIHLGANNLCFKVPEFVLLSFPRYSENSSLGGGESCRHICSSPTPKKRISGWFLVLCSSTRGGDRHMRLRTSLYAIQFRTTFIRSLLAIFWNEITTILTPSTSEWRDGGSHGFCFVGPWLQIRNVRIRAHACMCVEVFWSSQDSDKIQATWDPHKINVFLGIVMRFRKPWLRVKK